MSKVQPRSVGAEFGALQLETMDDLLDVQARAARQILASIHRIAADAFISRSRRSRDGGWDTSSLDKPLGEDPNDFDRPHHVFVVDGRRGSGKTTVLLTLYPYLRDLQLGIGRTTAPASMVAEMQTLGLDRPPAAQGNERAALTLPIVFTEDMETLETTMEAVFALMEQAIDDRIRADKAMLQRKELEELRDALRVQVGVGWTYSRKIGAEALHNDALDYTDFVRRRAEFSHKAYTKVTTWRRFVDRYLDVMGFEVLVLLFDDSDLNAAIAEDIVRAIRMYFSHPRIASVVAVDMPTLQHTLAERNLSQHPLLLSNSGHADFGPLADILKKTVAQETENVRRLLEKVMPRPTRYHLTVSEPKHLSHFFRGQQENIDEDAFSSFCRERFLFEPGRIRMEWWLLDGPYRRMVAADLREMIVFRRSVQEHGVSPLEVILKRPSLSGLSERLNNDLSNLPDLVDGDEIDESARANSDETASLERRFVDFWCDGLIAERHLTVPPVVRGWLAADLQTPNLERRTLRDEGQDLGIGAALKSSLLPRNCLYLNQLRHLEKPLAEVLPEATILSLGWDPVDDDPHDPDIVRAASELLDRITRMRSRRPANEILKLLRDRISLIFVPPTGDGDRSTITNAARIGVALAAAVYAEGEGSSAAQGVRNVLKAIASREAGNEVSAFLLRMTSAFAEDERRRQEALYLWANANQLAKLGDDTRLTAPRVAPVRLAAEAGPIGAPDRSRLRDLLDTAEIDPAGSKPLRHRLLHVWSVVPLLDVLLEFGTDYRAVPNVATDWDDILDLLRRSIEPFDETLDEEEVEWNFPDLERPRLWEIVLDIKGKIEDLTLWLATNQPAGTAAPGDFWSGSRAQRLAALLYTSEQWATTRLEL